MHTFLFLATETSPLDTGSERLLKLGTRLVRHGTTQDHHQLIHPSGSDAPSVTSSVRGATQRASIVRPVDTVHALQLLAKQLRQAEIIICHNTAKTISIILDEAQLAGQQDILNLLSPPSFGFDLGERAAICTQQLAADYSQYLGKPALFPDSRLATVYHRLFGTELPDPNDVLASAIATQLVYNFLNTFQIENGAELLADIVRFE